MCQSPIIVSVATEVEASCDAVWNVIANIEIAPDVITPVVSVERISNGRENFQVGTRWKEIRKYKGSDFVQIKTVTSIRREAGGYSVAINVSYPDEKFKDFTNTSTLEVRPSGGKTGKCLLIGSCGFMPGNLWSSIVFCFCGRGMARDTETLYLAELEDIGKAAVEQSQQQSAE